MKQKMDRPLTPCGAPIAILSHRLPTGSHWAGFVVEFEPARNHSAQ